MIRLEQLTSSTGLFQVSFGLLLLLASPVDATDTRVETLGASGLFLNDEDNIWYFPSTIHEYPNLMVLSLGGQASTLTPLSELRTFGTVYLPQGTLLGIGFGAEEKQVTYAPLEAAELLHLFWARANAGNRYALSISQFGAISSHPPSYEKLVSVTQAAAGFILEAASGNTVDLTLAYSGTWFKDIRNGTKISVPKGYHELAFRVRNRISLTDIASRITICTATLGTRGAENYPSEPVPDTIKDNYFTTRLGAAFEINYPEDLLVIFHASALYSRVVKKPTDARSNTWYLPEGGLGVEKWIRPWLALRAGAILQLQILKNDASGNKTSRSQVSTTPTLGLAVRFSGLQADFALDQEVLEDGLYFMSGTKVPLFNKVTLRYNF